MIDDSLMLLSFVKEILAEANYQVSTAPTAEEGLARGRERSADLDPARLRPARHEGRRSLPAPGGERRDGESLPIVYMSGFGADLQPDQIKNANVIGSLNKPFTSDLLIKTVENLHAQGHERTGAARIPTNGSRAASFDTGTAWPEPQAVATESAWAAPAWHTGARREGRTRLDRAGLE